MLKQPHVYKILVIVCHALVDDTGRKGVAEKMLHKGEKGGAFKGCNFESDKLFEWPQMSYVVTTKLVDVKYLQNAA